jgi:hypothetical protein
MGRKPPLDACFKLEYFEDSRKMSRKAVLAQFNRRQRKFGWVAVHAEPGQGVTSTGRGPVVPFVLSVCRRPSKSSR